MSGQQFKYEILAHEIEANIKKGIYRVGEKLPSIRELHEQLNISIVTINAALEQLENIGLIESRPRSGYYVKPPENQASLQFEKVKTNPKKVSLYEVTNSILSMTVDSSLLPLGTTIVSPEYLPYKTFSRILKNISPKELQAQMTYGSLEGDYELRRQIAQRLMGVVEGIKPEDIVITNGCMEAVSTCLMSLVKPGEVVAVESPTYFLLLQTLKELGVTVAEIPVTPEYGFDVDVFESLLKSLDIKACFLTPNFNNPLGTIMKDDQKEKLVHLAYQNNIPIIEDDVYSELHYQQCHPTMLKSFDQHGIVLTCSSYSKTLSPGLRVGWAILGNRFREKVTKLKGGVSLSTARLNQYLLREYIKGGGYDRYLRGLRKKLQKQTFETSVAIKTHFPYGTKLTMPEGGFTLWVELPKTVDSMNVFHEAVDQKILMVPGIICSNSHRFKNYIRLSCGYPFNENIEKGIARLGSIIESLV